MITSLEQEGDHRNYQEDDKQYFGNGGCRASRAAEAENTGYYSNDQGDNRKGEKIHSARPFIEITGFARAGLPAGRQQSGACGLALANTWYQAASLA